MPFRSLLRGFVFRVFGWLPVAFVLGYFAAPALLWPAARLAGLVARAAFADIVDATTQSGAILSFLTLLRPGESGAQEGQISVDVNMLLYGFGLPLYAALVLAAREAHWPRRLAIGYVALIPVITWGILADFLKNVAITSGPLVASQTGFVPWQREVIAFAYQFGTLILPTVAPAIAWVLLHRSFVERLRSP